MQGRTFALIMLFVGAAVSFALAMWSALHGRLPLVETAHAVLFAVTGLILAGRASDQPSGAGCRECGSPFEDGGTFCLRCGCYPRVHSTALTST